MEPVRTQLSNGQIVDAYPLTQAQKFMFWAFNNYGKVPATLNIGTGEYWKGDFDSALMKESIAEAIERTDCFRIRLIPDQQYGTLQYIVPKTEAQIEEVDYTGMSYDESYEIIKSWSTLGGNFFECPLNTIKIMHLPDGYNGIYSRLNHLAFDGYSTKVFLADIMGIYVSKKCGKPYPKPMMPYIDMIQKEFEYLDSDKCKEDEAFWKNYFFTETEPIFNDYLKDNRLKKERIEYNQPDRRFAQCFTQNTESRQLIYHISEEDTNTVLESCKENEISVVGALMFGLRSALSAFNDNQEDVSIKLMLARRSTLLEKKGGGNRWHMYSVRSIVDEEKTYKEATEIIEASRDLVYRHCNYDVLKWVYLKISVKNASLGQTYDSLTFSYHAPIELPYESDEVKRSAVGIWYNNNFSMQNLYLTIKHRCSDNGFDVIWEYKLDEDGAAEDVALLHEKMIKAILMGAKNPNVTVKEVLDEIKL